MNALLEQFIAESRELLEAASGRFLELERSPDDPELVNELFRAMHTIKGNSGLFDVPALTRTVHAAEDVLVAVREGALRLGPEHVDLLLDAMDQVSAWLDELERDGRLGEGADAAGEALAGRLRALLGGGEAAAPAPPEEDAPAEAGAAEGPGAALPPDWAVALPGEARAAALEAAGGTAVAVEYTPDENCFFAGDDPLQTARSAPGLVWLGVEPREPWPEDPEAFDPYRCVLRFRLLCAAEPGAVREHFQYAGEEAAVHAFDPVWLAVPGGEPQGGELWAEVAEDLRRALAAGDADALRARAEAALEAQGGEGWEPDCLRWIARLAGREGEAARARLALLVEALARGELPGEAEETPAAAPAGEASAGGPAAEGPDGGEGAAGDDGGPALDATARELLASQRDMLRTPCAAEVWDGRLASARAVCLRVAGERPELAEAFDRARAERDAQPAIEAIETLLAGEGAEAPAAEAVAEAAAAGAEAAAGGAPAAAAPQPPPAPSAAPAPAGGAPATPPAPGRGGDGAERPRIRTLKVDLERIDALMDLVGELVVAKNALPYLARRAEDVHGARELAREIKAQHAVIHRVTEALQAAVMQVRMIPLSHVFQRFPRLVRDLSRRLGKPIRLVVEGEEAEADKNVVEDLAEPLVHLLRNACDHRIEPPDEREAAGKPREGTVRLRAVAHDDHVVIEVSDDGRGMDPAVIRRKAYEKGVIGEQELESLDDQAALQLIFAPGFSTAERVSDVSGRGVGMDAVRAMVRRVGGEVRVHSVPGAGTTVRLVLPLSVAVSQVMIVEAGGQHFGVPVEAIRETVRVPAADIHRVKDREAVVLRDRLVPVHRLHRLLGLEEGERPEEEALLVVRVDGETAALVVDRFHEGVDVIQKPLEGVMAHFTIYAGTALLGDGRVLLVLNLRELLRCP